MERLPPPETFDILPGLHMLFSQLLADHEGSDAPLPTRDITNIATAMKLRIQKARAVLHDIPDLDRSVEAQREEIVALQKRVIQQRQALLKLNKGN